MRVRAAIGFDGNYRLYQSFQLTDKPITPPRQSLNIAWIVCRIAKHLTNLIDGGVQIAVDVDERVGPKPPLQLLPRHHFAGAFQQDGENLKRLAGESQLHSALAHFSRCKVNFKGSEPD